MTGKTAATIAAFTATAFLAGSALASSDDAWKQFSADVEAKCKAAVVDQLPHPRIVVDPTGSEHYGLALLIGIPKGGKTQASFLCVYDKQAKTAEIGSEIGADKMKVLLPGKANPGKAKAGKTP
jgi:hypothetical protein